MADTPTPPQFQFQMPDYSQFVQQAGFGYNNLYDQLRDAFSIPTRGGGVFMGNQAPRYGRPAPNLTFPTAFLGLLGQYIKPQGQQQMQRGMGGLLSPFQLPQGMTRNR